jgi:hypothetical protein
MAMVNNQEKRSYAMSIYEEYFDGRKPSKSQLIRSIKRGLKQGYTDFELSWGENMINLQKNHDNAWFGWGWIKALGGDNLAKELTQEGI